MNWRSMNTQCALRSSEISLSGYGPVGSNPLARYRAWAAVMNRDYRAGGTDSRPSLDRPHARGETVASLHLVVAPSEVLEPQALDGHQVVRERGVTDLELAFRRRFRVGAAGSLSVGEMSLARR